MVFVLAQAVLMPLLSGWAWWIPAVAASVLAFSIAQFLADRFIVGGENLLTTGHAQVNNTILLDITGFIAVAVGCVAIGVGVYLTYRSATWGGTGAAEYTVTLLVLSLASLAIAFALFAFRPHLVGISTSSTASAGDEAIGLLSFAIRSGLALASFCYLFVGVWSLIGLLLAVWVRIYSGGAAASVVFGVSVLAMLAGAVLPLILYVLYLLLYLVVDLVRAFLNMRQNVEAIAQRRPSG